MQLAQEEAAVLARRSVRDASCADLEQERECLSQGEDSVPLSSYWRASDARPAARSGAPFWHLVDEEAPAASLLIDLDLRTGHEHIRRGTVNGVPDK